MKEQFIEIFNDHIKRPGQMRFWPGWRSPTSLRHRPRPASIFRSRAAW